MRSPAFPDPEIAHYLTHAVRLQSDDGGHAPLGATLHWLAELNAVLPLVARHLLASGEAVPAEYAEHARSIREKNLRRAEWTRRFLERATSEKLDVILLKGSLFAEILYRDIGYKKMNDLDILVRREDGARIQAILKEVGFNNVGELFGQSLDSSSHHTPPFISPDLACVVGLHFGLCSKGSGYHPDLEGIWNRSQPLLLEHTVPGCLARRMTSEDNLLHLCIHLPFLKTGLRELADVVNLLDAGVRWPEFIERAELWGAEAAAHRVLSLCEALWPGLLPEVMILRLDAWRARCDRTALSDTDRLCSQPLSILTSRSTQPAKVEKAFAFFKLSPKLSEQAEAYVAMWVLLFAPKPKDLARVLGDPSLEQEVARIPLLTRLRLHLRAARRVWYAMCRDHGRLMMLASLPVNFLFLMRAAFAQVFRKGRPGASLRQHPAFALLEALE